MMGSFTPPSQHQHLGHGVLPAGWPLLRNNVTLMTSPHELNSSCTSASVAVRGICTPVSVVDKSFQVIDAEARSLARSKRKASIPDQRTASWERYPALTPVEFCADSQNAPTGDGRALRRACDCHPAPPSRPRRHTCHTKQSKLLLLRQNSMFMCEQSLIDGHDLPTYSCGQRAHRAQATPHSNGALTIART